MFERRNLCINPSTATKVALLFLTLLSTPFLTLADDNKEADPIFEEAQLKGSKEVQIIFGITDAVLASMLLQSAGTELKPDVIDPRVSMLKEARERLNSARELKTESELALISNRLETSLESIRSNFDNLSIKAKRKAQQTIDGLIENIAAAKQIIPVSDAAKAEAIEEVSKEISEIRQNILTTAIKTGKVPFLKKVVKGAKVVGGAVFIADLGGRIYLWKSEDVNPGFFPAGQYTATQIKKFALGGIELYQEMSTEESDVE
jgi:hypothetical protein